MNLKCCHPGFVIDQMKTLKASKYTCCLCGDWYILSDLEARYGILNIHEMVRIGIETK